MKLKLTNGKFTLIDDEDMKFIENKTLMDRSGYAGFVVHKNGKQKTYLIHRLIMNAKPDQLIDHINRNKLDNRKSNLRFTDRSKNAANCKVHKHNTTGYKGVSKFGNNRYRSYIVFMDKQISLGVYDSKKEAAIAYNNKAIELFGEHANLNRIKT
jgi:hypothetical protein